MNQREWLSIISNGSIALKILQYLPGLPPVMGGGMIKYALDLVQGEEEAGHEVILLVPGGFTHFHKDRTRIIKKKWNKVTYYSIINPLPVTCGKGVSALTELIDKGDMYVYMKFLEDVRPEIIHIHSLMGMHLAFLEAASHMGIPTVYTTHDYYGICPKAILLSGAAQCVVSDGSQCADCFDKITKINKVKWQQSETYRWLKSNRMINCLEYSQRLIPIKIYIRSLLPGDNGRHVMSKNDMQNVQQKEIYKKIRGYYREMFAHITKFHYNSRQSQEVFGQHLSNIAGEVIPISNRSYSDNRKIRKFGKILRIGFIGREAYKGFELLKAALDDLYTAGLQDFECHVYFNPREKLPPYIVSHAPYNEKSLEQVYDGIDILVLPSIWKETYGLVVPEALSRGIPVLVSNNVGAGELLTNHKGIGIVIDPTREALKEALERIYRDRDILKQMNQEIFDYKLSLDYEQHVEQIVHMYQNIGRHS